MPSIEVEVERLKARIVELEAEVEYQKTWRQSEMARAAGYFCSNAALRGHTKRYRRLLSEARAGRVWHE